ncbi:MAG: Kinesin [Thelocarpon impressellum]|nr:MAG: Kinesin [Thelocarpon impressellum]
MYFAHRLRFRALLEIRDIDAPLMVMALDPRSHPNSALAPPEMRPLKSSASSPSLRSRDPSLLPMGRPETPTGGGGNVCVVVRVRGFLPREIERGAECLVRMDPGTQETRLLVPEPSSNDRKNSRKVVEEKSFTFDHSFWSHDERDEHYAHQEDVYNSLGEGFLDHNFEGYHTCIFAYGQTGSGKSYTMMGTPERPGLIPRTCEDLFQRIEANAETAPSISYSVRVSYFEVYNEHVRDLLVPRQDPPYYLKIRESPTEGPYVKDLTDAPVKSLAEIMRHMSMGDASRTTASTKMNDTSSRSHAVFTIMLKQIHHDMDTDETTERTARIRLVDLAGSERAKATEATGQRLREGSNINKSLTTLGRVIAALAEPPQRPGASRGGRPKTKDVVPYRDSILTWLLKDSLGGNSKTAMIACIAPADHDETLSTLRYADQAKHIRTRAVVNQDSVSAAERDAQIAAMQDTIRALQLSVSAQAATKREADVQSEKLEEYQKQVALMQRLMEETRQVSECKIRALQTENEALRLHLKLAVDSLKNPIPEVKVAESAASSRRASTKENMTVPEMAEDEGSDDEEEEYDEPNDVEASEAQAVEMQAKMEELLKDLGLFRRKVKDDHGRFVKPPGEVHWN